MVKWPVEQSGKYLGKIQRRNYLYGCYDGFDRADE